MLKMIFENELDDWHKIFDQLEKSYPSLEKELIFSIRPYSERLEACMRVYKDEDKKSIEEIISEFCVKNKLKMTSDNISSGMAYYELKK
jgi:hypothetical protein